MANCSKCDGHCCKYVTIQVDEPKEDIDFEELKWFLCHENMFVYIDHDNQWCIEVKTPCKYQDPKTNLCTIYEKRPTVCSEHQADECESNEGYEEYYKKIFHTMEEIDAYRKELQSRSETQKIRQENRKKAEAAE
ncbi:MAG: YkgJ family cysteine cluster protein [Nanoarchaeota archaeon]|nr:YkgJ family cysteine cluster protein [Nanoarchaeota archaeon]